MRRRGLLAPGQVLSPEQQEVVNRLVRMHDRQVRYGEVFFDSRPDGVLGRWLQMVGIIPEGYDREIGTS